MSKLVQMPKTENSLVALNGGQPLFTFEEFFAPYGVSTPEVFVRFIDDLYTQYRTTQKWAYLSFGDKVDVEFRVKLLRALVQSLPTTECHETSA